MKELKNSGLKNFFTVKEVKSLGIKTKQLKYRNFIKEVHRRVVIEMLLGTEEGFILPYRLGHLSLKKINRLSGVRLKYMSNPKIEETIQYNPHSFGNVYEVNWNKERFLGMDLRYHKAHYFPVYNNLPMLYLRCYNFTPAYNVKTLLKYQIDNSQLNVS
jgi:hypothetical protein